MRKHALLSQILVVNTLLLAAVVVAASTAAPLHFESDHGKRQAVIFGAAVLATILVNAIVLRRRFAPLEQLLETMESVDVAQPGLTIAVSRNDSREVTRLHQAFNRMLSRLGAERAASSAAVLHAQEAERARIARDLHDEVNQALTGVLLRLRAIEPDAPPELRAELAEISSAASQAMSELLTLARELRPSTLDDHGLEAALRSRVDEFANQTGIATTLRVDPDLGEIGAGEQLVVYRVVQESLNNIAAHAGAHAAWIELDRETEGPVVRIADDGCGFAGPGREDGLGLTGMRERARLAGGQLDVRSTPGEGTTVELRL
jgi:two-component system, NarL family, sensor histidine kinase UhpB